MEVTEVRISRRTQGDGKLKGYAAVTFDDVFVVRDLKIIEGKKGLFVAMPSQKLQAPCTKCKKKNVVRAKFCNECGEKLPVREKTRREVHRDIAHPVNSDMRSYLQKVIIEAFQANQHDENYDAPGDEYEESYSRQEQKKEETKDVAPESYLSAPSLDDSERTVQEDTLQTTELLDTIE